MTLSEYESHLDMLRSRVSLQDDKILLNFSAPFSILLSDCTTDDGLIRQVRSATIKLLDEPSMHLTYVAHAIIQAARSYKIDYTDAAKLYKPHEIYVIREAVRNPGAPVRFEGWGESDGINAIVIERRSDPRTLVPARTVRLTRPAAGNVKFARTAEAAAVELVSTKSHIVFSFDGSIQWRFPFWASRTAPPVQCSRFALLHTMSADELTRAIGDVRALFAGLEFSYTAL